jgi:flagellar biosynthesis/type III secretory pathway chaperone
METTWEPELAKFLNDLMVVQDETLEMLNRKRQMIVSADTAGLAAIVPQEESLIHRLQECQERREELLRRAEQAGLPSNSLQALSRALPKAQRESITPTMKTAMMRTRLLHCESLTNWLVVQKTLLHLSQMLEIIATGGRMQPTYGKDGPPATPGSLVDRAA